LKCNLEESFLTYTFQF